MGARIRICANGTPRAPEHGNTWYPPDRPCRNQPLHGHIHCEECRREAGGYFVRRPRVLDRPVGMVLA